MSARASVVSFSDLEQKTGPTLFIVPTPLPVPQLAAPEPRSYAAYHEQIMDYVFSPALGSTMRKCPRNHGFTSHRFVKTGAGTGCFCEKCLESARLLIGDY